MSTAECCSFPAEFCTTQVYVPLCTEESVSSTSMEEYSSGKVIRGLCHTKSKNQCLILKLLIALRHNGPVAGIWHQAGSPVYHFHSSVTLFVQKTTYNRIVFSTVSVQGRRRDRTYWGGGDGTTTNMNFILRK